MKYDLNAILEEIRSFLGCPTPDEWIDVAVTQQDILLIDHANCEKKAATTAMNLLYRHTNHAELLKKMSQLAREEILHFEQVVGIMANRGIHYRQLSSSRYASSLRDEMRKGDQGELIDVLIVGAFIEARSCERFAKLAPHLDDELNKFYCSLLRSEGRHYQDYITFAQEFAKEPITERIAEFRELENRLILSDDTEFRFHSGVPKGL